MMAKKNPSLSDRVAKQLHTKNIGVLVAILTVAGALPVLIVGVAGFAISSVTLACIYLLGRRYEVWSR